MSNPKETQQHQPLPGWVRFAFITVLPLVQLIFAHELVSVSLENSPFGGVLKDLD